MYCMYIEMHVKCITNIKIEIQYAHIEQPQVLYMDGQLQGSLLLNSLDWNWTDLLSTLYKVRHIVSLHASLKSDKPGFAEDVTKSCLSVSLFIQSPPPRKQSTDWLHVFQIGLKTKRVL